jgi:hypothetical protein
VSTLVVIVGGPRDGETVSVDDGYGRVHIMVLANPGATPPPPDDPRSLAVHAITMPVRLTRNGYRCYWSERNR